MKKRVVILMENYEELKLSFSSTDDVDIVACTSSGKEGLDLIIKLRPDAIIMDLVLRDLDGISLLDKLFTLKLPCKILVYTAFDSDEIIKTVSEKGVSAYLVKHLSPEIIATRLRTCLESMPQSKVDTYAEHRVSNVFLTAGIPPHIKGYGFLRTGVMLAIHDPTILGNITKRLYPKIAEEHKTSPSKVERAIRHAIEVAWNRGRIENLNGVFGVCFYESGDKPTNGEFIALIADRLIQERHMGKLM